MARPNRALNYYGSKVSSAHKYPAPQFRTIVEPFAGGAGYSLLHGRDVGSTRRDVVLFDLNPDVIGAWRYLIDTPGDEVLRLPLLQPGDAIPLELPAGARLVIGWSAMMCGARPQRLLVPAAARVPSSFWGESKRRALAQIADTIKHWHAFVLGYEDVVNALDVTWFVDPPYQGAAGSHYVHSSAAIDYADLAAWCTSRAGQVVVCEGPEATWLPFIAHHEHASAPTADVVGRRVSTEVIWTRGQH
jgi:site-specific DNA-adenine methylase